MGNIIPRRMALGLIQSGKAKAETLVETTRRNGGEITYMAITRYDTQTTEHYKVADGHVSGTEAGREAEREAGLI